KSKKIVGLEKVLPVQCKLPKKVTPVVVDRVGLVQSRRGIIGKEQVVMPQQDRQTRTRLFGPVAPGLAGAAVVSHPCVDDFVFVVPVQAVVQVVDVDRMVLGQRYASDHRRHAPVQGTVQAD